MFGNSTIDKVMDKIINKVEFVDNFVLDNVDEKKA